MLELFYGRENIKKEAFVFEQICKAKNEKAALLDVLKNTVIIVPDQFKLATERMAMDYMNLPGIMGLEILSLRRLGTKIIQESGQSYSYIDKYGRHIILSDIMAENAKNLKVYGRMGHRPSFIELLNNLISEFKRFGVGSDKLLEIVAEAETDESTLPNLLKSKLKDISLIYDEYEKRIAGKYVDTEDRVNLFLSKIEKSELVVGKEIWIWGFDWLSPKDIDIISELMRVANVHMIFTHDSSSKDSQIFAITGEMMRSLSEKAKENGIEYRRLQIDDAIENSTGNATKVPTDLADASCLKKLPESIKAMEEGLFIVPAVEANEEAKAAAKAGEIMLVEAANQDSEAESAAAYILWLLRTKDYRYRDIAVICNDTDVQAETIRQQFEEYGLPLFVDKRKSLMNSPAITFLLSMVDAVSDGWRSEDIFKFLKTGYGPLSGDDIEILENYVVSYKIEGRRWKEPFTKALDKKQENEIAKIEAMRKAVVDFLQGFEGPYKEERSAATRTEAIYSFLREGAKLPDKLQAKITELETRNLNEEAGLLSQVWEQLVRVLSQMIEVMGDTKVSLDRYRTILTAGLSAVEIGMLPPGNDTLMIGTMQRSRIANAKAVVILGACEGMLPKSSSAVGILSEDEKKSISDKGTEVGKLQTLRALEENLALYRLLSTPSERLYMSYSHADGDGKEQKAAEIFNDISDFFDIEPVLDIVSQAEASGGDEDSNAMKLIHAPMASLRHLAETIETSSKYGRSIPSVWKEVFAWANEFCKEQTKAILAGVNYANKPQRLEKELVHKVFPTTDGELRVSPSSFEKYSKCPFSFFIQSGISPEERRNYGMEAREIGDIYHECLEELMKKLGSDGLEVCDSNSLWQKISRKEADSLLDDIFDEKTKNYRDGVARSGAEEKYRASRMRKVLKDNAWALLSHIKQGRIKSITLEAGFGFGEKGSFPPIKVKAGGEEVRIVGKIDRVDILEGEEIKIVDYKSGRNDISPDLITEGWKVQLMIYLKAAKGNRKPAGVFYYNISDETTKAAVGGSSNTKRLMEVQRELDKAIEKFNLTEPKNYAMSGLIVKDTEILRSVVGLAGDSDAIEVVSGCRYVKKDQEWKGKALMDQEEFQEMSESFDKVIQELCRNLVEGDISVKPKKRIKAKPQALGGVDACEYCSYKSICKFDTIFPGCTFEKINC